MTDPASKNPTLSTNEPPETFLVQVRDCLAHLYDLGYLQGHALAPKGANRGQLLRRLLMETVESLNPGPAIYFRAPQARPYNMLLLHYIERMTIQKAASELGISERQTYRELRDGETAVARLLWAQYEPPEEDDAIAEPAAPGDDGGQRDLEAVSLGELLRGAAATVQRLADQSNIGLQLDLQSSPEVRKADQAAARQILVSLFSHVIQAAAGDVSIRTLHYEGTTLLAFTFPSKARAGEEELAVDPIVQQLLQQVGWEYQQAGAAQGRQQIEIRLKSSTQAIVLIDDDEGFAGLVKRYLNGLPFRLVTAQSGLQGIETARATQPALILLDVMMPGLDGWETLQRLQTAPDTMGIPLIICSVFNDPELARSLGARQLLPKPVSREGFLAALETIGVL